jgi:IS5 family transposase
MTILIDVNSLAIKDVHYTTRKAWDGHIGMQVFRRNGEDLRVLSADANYSWNNSVWSVAPVQRDH